MKATYKEGSRFAFFQKFLWISMEKLKAGIFDSPQIKELLKDPMFHKALDKAELSARQPLKSVVTNFLVQCSAEYKKEIEKILRIFCQLGAWMSVKLHFLWPDLDYFSKKCGDLSEEQSEYFHQDIRLMEECYQDQLDVNFLVDYCWCLKRDVVAAKHRRKSLKRPFIHE